MAIDCWRERLPKSLLLKEKAFWLATLSIIRKVLCSPHPSRYSLDTFSRLVEGFYYAAFFMKLGFSI